MKAWLKLVISIAWIVIAFVLANIATPIAVSVQEIQNLLDTNSGGGIDELPTIFLRSLVYCTVFLVPLIFAFLAWFNRPHFLYSKLIAVLNKNHYLEIINNRRSFLMIMIIISTLLLITQLFPDPANSSLPKWLSYYWIADVFVNIALMIGIFFYKRLAIYIFATIGLADVLLNFYSFKFTTTNFLSECIVNGVLYSLYWICWFFAIKNSWKCFK